MNDTLTPLIAAYRAERRGAALDTAALRDRMLDAAARRRHRRSRRITWLIPVAAVLAGSAALAASAPTRAHVGHFLERLAVAVSLGPVERPAPPPSHPAARRSPLNLPPKKAAPADPLPPPRADAIPAPAPLLPAPALTLDPVPEIPRPPSAPAPAPALLRRAPAARTARELASPPNAGATLATSSHASAADTHAPVPRPSHASFTPDRSALTPPAAPSDPALRSDLAAYRVAHRYHFALADYASALTAWDAYLTRYPSGTFAPEARVNRAVALARLGEQGQARRSLRTIVKGAYGEPGRTQARQLLQALDPAKP